MSQSHSDQPTPHGSRLGTLSPVAILALLLAMAAARPGSVSAQATPKLSPELTMVRAALDKYRDPILAVHDGYLSTVGCLAFSKGMTGHGSIDYKAGAMGVHLVNTGNIGPTLDPAKPQVLIYEPVGTKLQLVAAEWLMPAQLAKEAPVIFGQPLQGPMTGHEPILPTEFHHWDLHVWLWKANPSGLFSATNPAVKCPAVGYTFDGEPPAMVKH